MKENKDNNSATVNVVAAKRQYSPAYYAMRKYAGQNTANWDRIDCVG